MEYLLKKVLIVTFISLLLFSLSNASARALNLPGFNLPDIPGVPRVPTAPKKPEPTETPTPTSTPKPTLTPVPTPTSVPTATVGPEEVTPTSTPIPTPTPTSVAGPTPTPTSAPGPTATPKPGEAEVGGVAEEGEVVGVEAPTPAPGEVMGLAGASGEGYTEMAVMILGALCAGVGLKLLRTSKKAYQV